MPSSRPTLLDLARAAGLSAATVDRAINNRPGVRARTREIVLTTARRLGYLPEVEAGARPDPAVPVGPAPRAAPARLAVLLPAGDNAFMETLRRQFETQAAARADLELRVATIEGFNPESLARWLDAIDPATTDGIALVALDHPLVREGIRRLAQRGLHVATLVSDVQQVPRIGYVGIDNRQAGRLAGYVMGRFLAGRAAPEAAFFAGSRAYRGHEEREMGFRSVLAEDFPEVRLVALREIMDDPGRARAETLAVLEAHPGLAAIYNAGAGNEGIASALRARGLAGCVVLVGHEATEGAKRLLLEGVMDAAIDQNPRVEARETLNLLASAVAGRGYAPVPPRLTIIFRENLPDD